MLKKIKYLTPVILFIAIFLLLTISTMRRKSVTFDEPAHLLAGYSCVALGDFHHVPDHPPLVKLLSGLMVRSLNPRIDTANWQKDDVWVLATKFFYQWNDADQVLFRGRLAIVLLSLMLGVVIFLAAWEIYSWKAGCLALTLYLFNPDFLAHGHLVTTDVGAASFFFISTYCFWRALNQLSLGRIFLTGLTIGLLLLTKFSSFLIFPIIFLMSVAFLVKGFTIQAPVLRLLKRSTTLESVLHKSAGIAGLILASILISWAMIWAGYGFRYRISPDPVFSQRLDWWQFELQPGLPVDMALWARQHKLLPEGYIYGFANLTKIIDGRRSFLLGRVSTGGSWYFFPITFLVKTPLAFIVLIFLSVYLARKRGWDLRVNSLLLLPPVFYFLYACSTPLNIGHRHIMPIYPFLIVWVSGLAIVYDEPLRRITRYAITLLLAWNIVSVSMVYPHFLAYFNEIAGGPSNGYRWLVDSNLDWGQDLKGLAEWRRAHPDEALYLSYFGLGNPVYYQLDARAIGNYPQLSLWLYNNNKVVDFKTVPSGSLLAVSVTNLQCLYINDEVLPGIEGFMARLRELKPVDNIGHSILIYRLP